MNLTELSGFSPGGWEILYHAKKILCSRRQLPFEKVEVDREILEELKEIILQLEKENQFLIRKAQEEDRAKDVVSALLRRISNIQKEL